VRHASPTYVYRYEVTDSDLPEVPVGTCLVDARRDLVKDWIVFDRTTDDMRAFTGERRERCCSECYAIHQLVRDHGHEGAHGKGAPYTATAARDA
jgi:hypothetical protein